MGDLTRAYFRTLGNDTGQRRAWRKWTHATTLQALHCWVSEEGRTPTHIECRATEGLPSYMTVLHLWGGYPHFLTAYAEQKAMLSFPGAPPKETPPAGAARDGTVRCLRCDRAWHSPDRRRCRICPRCHTTPIEGDMSWMNG